MGVRQGIPKYRLPKAISKYFAVSIDELLSGDALLSIAEDESREREARLRSLTFGLLDCAAAMLLFLPSFADRTGGAVRASALLSLSGAAPYVRAAYLFIVSVTVIWGVLTLSLQNCRTPPVWLKCCGRVSAGLSAVAAVIFIAGMHPYAAALTLVFLLIKLYLVINRP